MMILLPKEKCKYSTLPQPRSICIAKLFKETKEEEKDEKEILCIHILIHYTTYHHLSSFHLKSLHKKMSPNFPWDLATLYHRNVNRIGLISKFPKVFLYSVMISKVDKKLCVRSWTGKAQKAKVYYISQRIRLFVDWVFLL